MKKKILLVLMAAVIVFVLYACFGGDNTSAVITDTTGKKETYSTSDLVELYKKNEVKYDKQFQGAQATITGEITNIDGGSYYTDFNKSVENEIEIGYFFHVEVSSNNPALSQFEVGDIVKVSGTLGSRIGSQFYLFGDHKIEKAE